MDPAEHLPVELLRRIIELAIAELTVPHNLRPGRAREANRFLRRLALVSHVWREVSRNYLYAAVCIDHRKRANKFMRTLDLHPDWALLVKSFELGWNPIGETLPWRKRTYYYVLSRCSNLEVLEMRGKDGQWPNAWDAVVAKSSLRTLHVICVDFSIFSATFASLRTLTLREVTLPQHLATFSEAFPSLRRLSVDFYTETTLHTEAGYAAIARFVVAMAPQLVALTLGNGMGSGIPLSLVQHVLTIGTHLNRFGTFFVFDYKLSPSPLPTSFDRAELPCLDLWLNFTPWAPRQKRWSEQRWASPAQERLWADFEHHENGVLDTILARRRVQTIVLEDWWTDGHRDGIDFAARKLREKDPVLKLNFRCRGSFYNS